MLEPSCKEIVAGFGFQKIAKKGVWKGKEINVLSEYV